MERHLAMDGMDAKIHGSILCDAAPGIGESTLTTNGPALIIAYAHCIEQGLATKTGPAHQKAAVESVHFPLWRYNPEAAEKKITIDSQDKSDTVSFAKNAVSKELGENRFKQLIKKIGEEKAMAMLQKSEEGFKENYQLIKKLAETM